MTILEKREACTRLAWACLHRPYRWTGDDPGEGFDCSGFIVYLLQSIGLLPWKGDWSAQGLFDEFRQHRLSPANAQEGCLIFFGKSETEISHVEYCLSDELMIGASGGGSTTTTEAEAWRQNAYLRIKPIRIHHDTVAAVNPF